MASATQSTDHFELAQPLRNRIARRIYCRLGHVGHARLVEHTVHRACILRKLAQILLATWALAPSPAIVDLDPERLSEQFFSPRTRSFAHQTLEWDWLPTFPGVLKLLQEINDP